MTQHTTGKPYVLVIDGQLKGFYPTMQAAESAVAEHTAKIRKSLPGHLAWSNSEYTPFYTITYDGR